MLPTKNRLTKKDDFQLVHKKGKFFSTNLFSLLFLPNELPQTRIGIVVSKKSFKQAVDRNRVKRLMRETLRQELPHIAPGLDIVVHAKLSKMASAKEISAALADLLKKSRLLH